MRTKESTVVLVGAMLAGVCAAQDTQRVEVTGSRVRVVDAVEAATPVRIYDREAIRQTGATTVLEFLDALQSINGSGFRDTGGDGTSAPGSSASGLRNFGTRSTLVLLNSRRLAPYPLPNFSEVFTNIDSLPMAAIDRIEILKAGGAAIYGSEAVAGVINIVTRQDLRGVIAQASGRQSLLNGDFASRQASLSGGWGNLQTDGFNVLAHAEFFHRDHVVWRDVIGYVNPEYVARVPSLGTFSTYSYPGNLIGVGPVTGCDRALVIDGLCRYDRYRRFDAMQQADRAQVLTSGRLDLGDGTHAFAELLWSRTQTRYEHAFQPYGSGLLPIVWVDPTTSKLREFDYIGLPATHPLNPTGSDGLEFRYRFVDGPNVDIAKTDQYRLLTGLRGPWRTFEWEAAVGVMGGASNLRQRGGFSASGFRRVIGNWDQPDPQFFNRSYRIGGSNSADVTDALFPVFGYAGHTRQVFADARLVGDVGRLPAGPMVLSVGADLRHERYTVDPTQNLRSGDMVGYGLSASDGTRTFGSLFGELALPVTKELEATAALRFDKFTGFDGHVSPKLALRYKPSGNWTLRATVETGFRTPNLVESANSTKFGFETLVDPKRCPQARALGTDLRTAASKLKEGDPQMALLMARADLVEGNECQSTLTTETRGNPDLKPETSGSQTVGLVFTSGRDTSASIDYWRLARRNEIAADSNQDLLTREVPGLESQIVRAELLDDRTFSAEEQQRYGVKAGPLRYVASRFKNVGKTTAAGIDIAARTAFRMPAGTLSLALDATYQINFRYWSEARGGYGDNLAGRAGNPRWVGDASVGWATSKFNHSAIVHYRRHNSLQGDYFDQSCASLALSAAECRLAAYVRWDYALTYTGVPGLTLSAYLQNVFNRRPPDRRTAVDLIPQNVEDVQGRMLKVGLEYRWR